MQEQLIFFYYMKIGFLIHFAYLSDINKSEKKKLLLFFFFFQICNWSYLIIFDSVYAQLLFDLISIYWFTQKKKTTESNIILYYWLRKINNRNHWIYFIFTFLLQLFTPKIDRFDSVVLQYNYFVCKNRFVLFNEFCVFYWIVFLLFFFIFLKTSWSPSIQINIVYGLCSCI